MSTQKVNDSIFEQIVETNWVAVTAADLNGIVNYANKSAYELYGYNDGELIGQSVDIFNGDPHLDTQNIVAEITENGGWSGEIIQKRKDGSTFTALLTVWLIMNEEGEPIALASNSKDISELKEADRKIKESEQNLKEILDSLPICIYIMDSEGKPYYANDFTKVFAKRDRDTDISELETSEKWKVYKQFSDEEYPIEELPIMRAMYGKTSTVSDLDIIIQDERYHVTCNAQPVMDGDKVKYAVSTFSDISDIVEKEAELSVIMDSQENFMLSVDTDMKIIRYNNAFAQAINARAPGILKPGISMLPFIPKEQYDETIALYNRAFDGETVIDERTYHAPSGLLTFESRYAPIYRNNKVFAVAISSQNITPRKQREAKLKETLKEKELLLNEIHHRVKNNLAIVSSLLQLEELKTDNDEVKDILVSSQNRIKSTALVHQFLYQNDSIARIEFKAYLEEFIRQVERSMLLDMEITTNVIGQDFTLDIEQAIPCGLILNELFTNSVKHAFNDIDTPEINISIQSDNNTITIEFQDNGSGLPDNFNSSSSLGMTVVKTLVKQLKGKLQIDSNQGATFLITFDV